MAKITHSLSRLLSDMQIRSVLGEKVRAVMR